MRSRSLLLLLLLAVLAGTALTLLYQGNTLFGPEATRKVIADFEVRIGTDSYLRGFQSAGVRLARSAGPGGGFGNDGQNGLK